MKPHDKGMLGLTLRYPYEIRKPEDYFEDIADEKITKDARATWRDISSNRSLVISTGEI